MNTVGFFDEVDPGNCGGKGKNLIALTEHRFPVPPGFVVTVDAYALYRADLEMPESVRRAITDCYLRLVAITGNGRVAVRSSAASEDSAAASFAGLYDSFLDVEGAERVVERVIECWRSLHSERSLLYRKMMRLPREDAGMAVVVQTMLAPRAAGVVFTANPYTLDTGIMIVEASRGIGENVVAGKVTPDYFEISTRDGLDIVTRKAGSGGPEDAGGGKPTEGVFSIEDESLLQLCALARDIEQDFGRPQDIEWALRDDLRFAVLQSRPLARFNRDG